MERQGVFGGVHQFPGLDGSIVVRLKLKSVLSENSITDVNEWGGGETEARMKGEMLS